MCPPHRPQSVPCQRQSRGPEGSCNDQNTIRTTNIMPDALAMPCENAVRLTRPQKCTALNEILSPDVSFRGDHVGMSNDPIPTTTWGPYHLPATEHDLLNNKNRETRDFPRTCNPCTRQSRNRIHERNHHAPTHLGESLFSS